MDVFTLSRIQFAITVFYHFLFVPLTLGLSIMVAVMETRHASTGNPIYRRMADFWGKLFTINFVLGTVTGITMEFQFGTNWSEYAKFMGDIFGSPLAIEALLAFFLESTFIGLWIFGKEKLTAKLRAVTMWLVALGTNLSAVWIIIAGGFMQNPVGYVLRNGRVELENFFAVVTNSFAWYMFFHTVLAGYLLSSFFVMGVSAYHLLKKSNVEFFEKSFRFALVFALIATILVPTIGHFHGAHTAEVQPAKAAAFDAMWETEKSAPFYLFVIPDPQNERNAVQLLGIPYLGSLLYNNNPFAEVKGLKEIPADERPNVNVVFWSFRLMVLLGLIFIAQAWYGYYLVKKNRLLSSPRYLKIMLYSIPLPYIAINLGWTVTEMGRQPWVVYGLLKTKDAVSPIAASQVWFSLIGLVVFYTILIIADVYLIQKFAKKGPDGEISKTITTNQNVSVNS